MDTDREWEIMLLEIEAENKLLIERFYLERMRPSDLQAMVDQFNAQEAQQQQQQFAPPQEPQI